MSIVRICALTYVLFAVVLYVRQDQMFYFPDHTPLADCPDLLDAELVNMSGTRGYFFQNGTSTKLAVLYHGNAARACDRAFYRTPIEHAGYSWLFVEYAGFAGDGKTPTTEAVLSDVAHVHEWVKTRAPTALALIGESIGSGPASFHSSLLPGHTLILIAPLDRLSLRAGEIYPFYPIALMLKNDFDNITWAKSASRVLIVHGEADTIIPIEHGKNLFAQLPQIDKKFVALPGLDHNDTFGVFGAQIAILRFLQDGPQ